MFRYPRPAEELYDVENDRYELNNLAADTEHHNVLERMRGALSQWQSDFGDMGDISEEQMVAQWYPDGKQPQTAAPIFIPINAEQPGTTVADDAGEWSAPLLLQLHCSTHGASIAYTTEQGEDAHWRLYTEPLHIPCRRNHYASESESASAILKAKRIHFVLRFYKSKRLPYCYLTRGNLAWYTWCNVN